MSDEVVSPKFKKKQIVRLALFNDRRKPKSDLARKAVSYASHLAEVVSVGMYEAGSGVTLIYRVKVDDGRILSLTEDCLMLVNERF